MPLANWDKLNLVRLVWIQRWLGADCRNVVEANAVALIFVEHKHCCRSWSDRSSLSLFDIWRRKG